MFVVQEEGQHDEQEDLEGLDDEPCVARRQYERHQPPVGFFRTEEAGVRVGEPTHDEVEGNVEDPRQRQPGAVDDLAQAALLGLIRLLERLLHPLGVAQLSAAIVPWFQLFHRRLLLPDQPVGQRDSLFRRRHGGAGAGAWKTASSTDSLRAVFATVRCRPGGSATTEGSAIKRHQCSRDPKN